MYKLTLIALSALTFSRTAFAGTEYSDLASWESIMGASASTADWTSVADGSSVDGMAFTGYQFDLLAGASLIYETSAGIIMSANDTDYTQMSITLDTAAYGIAIEATSVYADLTAEGYNGGSLVDSIILTNPGSESAVTFYGIVFSSLVDEVRIVSSSTGDGVIFSAMYFDIDDDGDGYAESDGDCDDADATAYPGNTEVCDGIDNDCNGSVDDSASDATEWCEDADLDGHCSSTSLLVACDDPGDTWSDGNPQDDCDDADATAYPGNTEVCDGIDNDCNSSIDDSATDASTWCDDADSDGYSDPADCVTQCDSPGATYSATNPVTDCDDGDADINPGEPEVPYNGTNDDCDETTADDDLDGDSWGSDFDCDDADPAINPDATEVADGIDNDCDGATDEGTSTSDDDGDGQSEDGGDCNDSDPTVYLGAEEICNTVDNDCDGLTDAEEVDGDGAYIFDLNGNDFADCLETDQDGDGFVVDDCQPFDGSSYPGAPETCDGIDNDCDDTADEGTECYDDDDDGWTELDGDCDDADALINPIITEVWYDGVDSDCSGGSDYDQDGDGYDSSEYDAGADCDDLDAAVNPDAAEVLNDGVDNDCDESTPDVEEPDDTGDDTGDIILEEPRTGIFIGGGGCACNNQSSAGFSWWALGLIGLIVSRRRE